MVCQLKTSFCGDAKNNFINGSKGRSAANGSSSADKGTRGRITRKPPFDGDSGFNDYLVQFEMVSQLNQWSEDIMALQLASCLKD